MSEGTKSSLVSVATNLYRHPENKIYWGRKKVAGMTLWHSLDTTDRKLAERNLTKWIGELTACDTSSGNVTLDAMIERFLAARAGHKGGTVRTEKSIAKVLRRDLQAGKGYPQARPRIITDNGPQFIARDFKEFIRLWQTTHVLCSPHYPQSSGSSGTLSTITTPSGFTPGSVTSLPMTGLPAITSRSLPTGIKSSKPPEKTVESNANNKPLLSLRPSYQKGHFR